jgi:hypothetical protein
MKNKKFPPKDKVAASKSSIESCLKIIEQEINKLSELRPERLNDLSVFTQDIINAQMSFQKIRLL